VAEQQQFHDLTGGLEVDEAAVLAPIRARAARARQIARLERRTRRAYAAFIAATLASVPAAVYLHRAWLPVVVALISVIPGLVLSRLRERAVGAHRQQTRRATAHIEYVEQPDGE
jgi:hypothetical protein